jgi:hypothetical protein
MIKEKNPCIYKNKDGNPSTRNTRQIKAKNMSH